MHAPTRARGCPGPRGQPHAALTPARFPARPPPGHVAGRPGWGHRLPEPASVSSRTSRLAVTLDPDYVNIVPEWQLWVGGAAGAFPFVVASFEFGKRILLQRQCEVCAGSGLVRSPDASLRKCPACGGFLPWQSWDRFFQSNQNIGNGGPLLRPAQNYDVMQDAARSGELPYKPAGDDDDNGDDTGGEGPGGEGGGRHEVEGEGEREGARL